MGCDQRKDDGGRQNALAHPSLSGFDQTIDAKEGQAGITIRLRCIVFVDRPSSAHREEIVLRLHDMKLFLLCCRKPHPGGDGMKAGFFGPVGALQNPG